ncbi:MAG TPA: tRNA uridine-5-carboxymethylaminomethyl(34) synthesis enzyme MnmG [Spirochaetota bacterium]|nr:tRNA uridine-5-carboxymethylaminomethyl(34) synthesis enzyme MnmG [Spirochaetota bacterium]
MTINNQFTCIVIGGGHAGIEAALACAKNGLPTALFNINIDQLAYISCNPSVGGLAKSHIVKEIDALGGVMGKLTDTCALQYKVLNRSKGIAVHSLRAQIDKYQYTTRVRELLETEPMLTLMQDIVTGITVKNNTVTRVITERGGVYSCKSAVIATGTFLNGKLYIGNFTKQGGRYGELGTIELSRSLKKNGFKLKRLKTGTPARVLAAGIDFDKLTISRGDSTHPFFSWQKIKNNNPTLPCYSTYTNTHIHNIIKRNKKKSPLFRGDIKGIGPRYCPSIEDKIFRFPAKNRHQLFLEPEDHTQKEYYVNGFSSSLPEDLYYRLITSLPGMEKVKIIKPAYAVEYDYINPVHLKHSLESKLIKNLFFAGQINGTSGYEEAAGQGLIAGINAAMKIKKLPPFIPERYNSYIGVMIDDLVLKGTNEPYRMFTSRSENRLSLRLDNAELRLTAAGRPCGLLSDRQWRFFKRKQEIVSQLKNENFSQRLQTKYLPLIRNRSSLKNYQFSYLFKRSDLDFTALIKAAAAQFNTEPEFILTAAADIKYEGYIKKQEQVYQNALKRRKTPIPSDLDYTKIRGLKKEAVTKLNQIRPENLEYAARIPGITPSDIQILVFNICRK